MMNKEKQNIALEKYLLLLEDFTADRCSAEMFEKKYLDIFKSETVFFNDNVFLILNNLFGDVDAFVADPQIRSDADLNEAQLLESAKRTLENLRLLLKE